MASISVGKRELIWVYFSRFLTIGINILLLPIIMKYLKDDELGLWYVFASISQIVNLFDFGFNATISRHMTYAWSGAGNLKKFSVADKYSNATNSALVSEIIITCRLVYLVISFVGLAVMATAGTAYIYRVTDNGVTTRILLAWIVYIVSVFLNMFYGYWASLLQGIGAVAERSKMTVYSKISQIIIAATTILCGLGLFGFVISYLVSGLVLRISGKIYFVRYTKSLSIKRKVSFDRVKRCFSAVWATAWKDGVVMLAQYLATQANTLICAYYIDLASTSVYGVMTQIVSIIAQVAASYYNAYQPVFSSACLKKDIDKQKEIVCVTDFIYKMLFILGSVALLVAGIPLIKLLRPGMNVNVLFCVALLVFYYFFNQKDLFASMIASFNEIPYWPAYVISAACSLGLSVFFVRNLNMGIMGLITAQLIVNAVYNFWKWPGYLMSKIGIKYPEIYFIGYANLSSEMTKFFRKRERRG